MPEITAFRALRYDPARVTLSQVITPPYDVLDAAQRAALAARSPYNFVGIDVPDGSDRATSCIRYVSDTRAALDQIARGDGQLALMVRPATIAQIKQTADAGQVMPQKSTYLFPKLASGLVLLPDSDEVL